MSLFRRQTDEVFTTLQQVQRRLSQNTESGAEHPRPLPTTPTYAGANVRAPADGGASAANRASADRLTAPVLTPMTPVRDVLVGPPNPDDPSARAPALTFRPTASSIPEPIPDEVFQSTRHRGVHVGTEAIATLVVVWVLTVVLAFILGQQLRSSDSAKPATEIPQGKSTYQGGESTSGPVTTTLNPGEEELLGDQILVLKSSNEISEKAREEFERYVQMYNGAVQQPVAVQKGYKPWFAIRYPESGGIQLVFGLVNGRFGINAKSALAKLVANDLPPEFKDPMWINVR